MGRTLTGRVRWLVASRRVILGAVVALGYAVLLASPAAATVSGGCTLTGTSTSGGQTDLTANPVWHLRSADRISARGNAPSPQTQVSARAYAFGFALPVASGTSAGATAADAPNYDVATFALLGRVFVVEGSTTGPAGGCSGQIQIVIDDVNPFLTVLGGGGVVAVVLGLIGTAWAVRRPTGVGRRIGGLVSLALIGAGGSLVIQQTSTPGGNALRDAGLARSAFADSVVGPAQLAIDPAVLVQGLLLSMLVVLVMPFPSQLFNATLEENYDSIRAGFRRLPILSRLKRESTGTRSAGGSSRRALGYVIALGFVLVSGLLYAFLDPAFGLNGSSFVTFVGIVGGLVLVTWAAALPRRAVHVAVTGEQGHVSVVPGTLIVAAVCVLISRLVGFMPGYLYGLILGYSFARQIDPVHEARAWSASAWWMLGLAVVAWFSLGAVRTPGLEGSLAAAIAAALLSALVVAGIEGIVFGLMPLRFLPGESVYRWRRLQWGVLYGIGIFAFLTILVNPTSGYIGSQGSVSFVSAVALFLGFGLTSVLFWGWFRIRHPAPAT